MLKDVFTMFMPSSHKTVPIDEFIDISEITDVFQRVFHY